MINNNKEIFLPDSSIKLGNLKKNLSDVYGLSIITKKEKYIYIGIVTLLTGIILYNYLKEK
jgi:hypothetical protein